MLSGDNSPFTGFGVPAAADEIQWQKFSETVKTIKDWIKEGFAIECDDSFATVHAIEALIAQMWDEEWEPSLGDVNLFLTSFGVIITNAILKTLGGTLVMRSPTHADHASIWWPDLKIEAFPFHTVGKRLWNRDGVSIAFTCDSIAKLIQDRNAEK